MIFDVIGPSFGPLFSNYTYEEASNSAKQKFSSPSGPSLLPSPIIGECCFNVIITNIYCVICLIILIHIELYVFRDHEEYITSRRNGRTASPYILGNIDVEKELSPLQVPATNKTKFASIVPENMKLVYLRQSFVHELLKTESYETELIGSFVRVPLPLDDRKRMSYQLVQVTGIINEVGSIKLQLLSIAREISIDLLQERNFTENFAKEMRHIEAEIGHTNERDTDTDILSIFFSLEILPQSISARFDFNLIISQIKGFIISNDTRGAYLNEFCDLNLLGFSHYLNCWI
ncbi:hypothetical protein M9H77_06340 [Catharanthus roseus]|uniref:Uncharacterized protein n=1 Tax=Catharanthus roseus TaxID=4058 RepID=A0ACC0BRY3_CATRO|nr:hypothetical protein M9H77_06340 [Catharanthus roseus]